MAFAAVSDPHDYDSPVQKLLGAVRRASRHICVLMATQFMVGRCSASAIASASRCLASKRLVHRNLLAIALANKLARIAPA